MGAEFEILFFSTFSFVLFKDAVEIGNMRMKVQISELSTRKNERNHGNPMDIALSEDKARILLSLS